jgi:hypothetical protein
MKVFFRWGRFYLVGALFMGVLWIICSPNSQRNTFDNYIPALLFLCLGLIYTSFYTYIELVKIPQTNIRMLRMLTESFISIGDDLFTYSEDGVNFILNFKQELKFSGRARYSKYLTVLVEIPLKNSGKDRMEDFKFYSNKVKIEGSTYLKYVYLESMDVLNIKEFLKETAGNIKTKNID